MSRRFNTPFRRRRFVANDPVLIFLVAKYSNNLLRECSLTPRSPCLGYKRINNQTNSKYQVCAAYINLFVLKARKLEFQCCWIRETLLDVSHRKSRYHSPSSFQEFATFSVLDQNATVRLRRTPTTSTDWRLGEFFSKSSDDGVWRGNCFRVERLSVSQQHT